MTRRQYQEFQKAQQAEIHRVKMYKAKKQWITAGLTVFSMAVGITAFTTTTAHAATTWGARSTEAIQASLQSEGTTPYKIVWGDTLSTIAAAANKNGMTTSVSRLAEINQITNINLIYAGNKLWFNGTGSNGTVTVIDKNGKTHTFNLNPNQPVQSNNNGTTTIGGTQSNGHGSANVNNSSVNNNANDNHAGNTNNGAGNTNNANNNGNGTTDPTTPTNPTNNEVAYKINLVDYTNGNKAFKTIELKGKVGDKVSYTAEAELDVNGKHYYLGSPSDLKQTITLNKDATKNVINVKYRPQTLPESSSYVVNYVDESGKPIAKSKKVDNVKMMSDIVEYAPEIAGYTVKNSNVINAVMSEENQVLTFVYTKNTAPISKADITIKAVDQQGNSLATETIRDQEVGKNYTATAKAINGYTLKDSATKTIKVAKNNNVITFTYAKNEVPVEKTSYTVSYQAEDGTKLRADKVVANQEVGKSVTETAPTFTGYTLKGNSSQTITLAKANNHVTFTYKADAPVGDHSTPINAPEGTAGLLDGNTIPAGNTHNLWFYMDKQQAPAGQTKSNLMFSSMQAATDFAENYLDSTMLDPNALFNGYAVNQVFGDGLTPVCYTIYWR